MIFHAGTKYAGLPSNVFTDTTGIQQHLKVPHAEIKNYIDAGMPCLPAPNDKGLRFNVAECEAWREAYFAVAEAVAERLGWNLPQSKEWADRHDLSFAIDGDGKAVLDDDSFNAAVKRDQAEFAARRAAELAARREEEARDLSEAGSTEPAEEIELAA